MTGVKNGRREVFLSRVLKADLYFAAFVVYAPFPHLYVLIIQDKYANVTEH